MLSYLTYVECHATFLVLAIKFAAALGCKLWTFT